MTFFFKSIAYVIILILTALIIFFGVRIYVAIDSSSHDEVDDGTLSVAMQETVAEHRETFWVDDDDLSTYRITKAKAEEVLARNSKKEKLTKIELNDEMLIMTNYAASARNVYPEEGLRAFAQIYNDERYSGRYRANALLHVMFYPIEKLGTEDLSIQNANDWIFSEDLLGSVLKGTKYERVYLADQRTIFEASAIGLARAAEVSDSVSLNAKIVSLRYDVNLNLLVEDMLATKSENVWARLGEETWSDESVAKMEVLLDDYRILQQQIIDGFNNEQQYNDEYAHAAKNVLRSYTTMLAFGIDTAEDITAINDATTRYANKYRPVASPELVQKINSYAGVDSLYMICSYIIKNGYNLESPAHVDAVLALAQPFLKLSYGDLRIFLVTAALGERESGVCYQPFVLLGQKSTEFREALIYGVGRWEESQFQ